MSYYGALREHYRRFFGENSEDLRWNIGSQEALDELGEGFRIVHFPPSDKRRLHVYATLGMSAGRGRAGSEIFLYSYFEDEDIVEMLTVIAHYHRTGAFLDAHHTVNIGRPWMRQSSCAYGILSPPYQEDVDLEFTKIGDCEVRILWVIPITEAELQFKKKHGAKKLEERFQGMLDFANPDRSSVV